MICLILFSKFSEGLPAFTCAGAIGNVLSICLGVNIKSWLPSETLATPAKILRRPFSCVYFLFGNMPLPNTLRTFWFPSTSIIGILRASASSFLTSSFGFFWFF